MAIVFGCEVQNRQIPVLVLLNLHFGDDISIWFVQCGSGNINFLQLQLHATVRAVTRTLIGGGRLGTEYEYINIYPSPLN